MAPNAVEDASAPASCECDALHQLAEVPGQPQISAMLDRGAQLLPDNSVRFTLWAPSVKTPRVRVCSGPAAGDYPLSQVENERGIVRADVPNVGANADYGFLVDGDRLLPDPVSRWQPNGVHQASRVLDPNEFTWTDDGWRGRTIDDLVIYELHVGTFTPEGTFDAIIPKLSYLRTLGATAIELMPVAQFPGSRNWGYDGVGLYAPQSTYGGPHALKRLVDAAHAAGLAVILDVVYNHVGPEGNYLDAFGPYHTDRYTTPWGRALNYDGAGSDEVRRFIIQNALYWISEYHIDGLRLDAVHSIYDFGARHVLEELTTAVHDLSDQLGRFVVVIGESDLNDPKLLRPTGDRGFGLDGQWSDDLHHAVHAMLTGERQGYYADFGSVSTVAAALREPFVLDGKYSVYRQRKHGTSSEGIPRRRFVVAMQNHDQIGNRAAGDRLSTLLSPEKLRLAAALLFLSPFVPLLFMGEEYGESNPFHYFIDHGDGRLIEAVRDGRKREYAAFGWTVDESTPDAHNGETFSQSKLDWSKPDDPENKPIVTLYRDILALRRDEPLLKPDGSRISVEDGAPGWITMFREPMNFYVDSWSNEVMLCVFNCHSDSANIPVPGSAERAWSLRLSTDAPWYGGEGRVPDSIPAVAPYDGPKRLFATAPEIRTVTLPAWSAAVYTGEWS